MTSPQRIIEPGLTAFSAAEIHVVEFHLLFAKACLRSRNTKSPAVMGGLLMLQAVVPIGLVPEDLLHQYLGLITKHRQARS